MLNKKLLNAGYWLGNSKLPGQSRPNDKFSLDASYYPNSNKSIAKFANCFNSTTLKNFFIPEWEGDCLISKVALTTIAHLEKFHQDAIKQFANFYMSNRSLKMSIYEEYLSFCKLHSLQGKKIDNLNLFWSEISRGRENIKNKALNEFVNIYCFRSVTVYIHKLRFMVLLANHSKTSLTESNILNPHSFLSKTFLRNSSSELVCESLQSNHYSWFRPSAISANNVSKLSLNLLQISTPEMIKVCNYNSYKTNSKNLSFESNDYCHSLSQKSFGLFLFELINSFPKWLNKNPEDDGLQDKSKTAKLKNLNTKFSGDYLQSFSVSHWLSQESNISKINEDNISPTFIGTHFNNGEHLKIINELLHLSFLTKQAQQNQKDPISHICQIMRKKYDRNSSTNSGQISMALNYDTNTHQMYDRIVINNYDIPKNNPHHYLINSINSQYKELNDNGVIIIASNQRLFVPSQSERIDQLLRLFKTEAIFNLDQLNAKGEVCNYIYILSKRDKLADDEFLLAPITESYSKKQACLQFHFKGELARFNQFSNFVKELKSFSKAKSPRNTSLYQNNLKDDLLFEFHQDAIIEGKLVSANSNDENNIIHPNFFKNLTETCVTFNQFFYIENLNAENNTQKNINTSDLFGPSLSIREKFSTILIVNYKDPHNITLELTNSDSYEAKIEQYGNAYFQYFGLFAKRADTNINIFREFFNSSLGKQIIQFSLNGSFTKLKSKVNALLVPKIFINTQRIPTQYLEDLEFLKLGRKDFMNIPTDDLVSKFNAVNANIEQLSEQYPWNSVALLSHFLSNLKDCEHEINSNSNEHIFNNPYFHQKLVDLNTYPIYPNNEDIFIELLIENMEDLNQVINQIVVVKEDEENQHLLLNSHSKSLIKLFSTTETLSLINFIISSSPQLPLIDILKGLELPRANELFNILQQFKSKNECLISFIQKTTKQINQIFLKHISSF